MMSYVLILYVAVAAALLVLLMRDVWRHGFGGSAGTGVVIVLAIAALWPLIAVLMLGSLWRWFKRSRELNAPRPSLAGPDMVDGILPHDAEAAALLNEAYQARLAEIAASQDTDKPISASGPFSGLDYLMPWSEAPEIVRDEWRRRASEGK